MKTLAYFLLPIFLFGGIESEKLFALFNISEETRLSSAKEIWLQQGKERWHFQERFEELAPLAWPIFEEMGMVQKISPAKNHYQTVLVLGSLLNTAERRVKYLIETGVTFEHIVFLTGARPLLESEKKVLPDLDTEYEMAKWVYDNSDLPKDVPVTFINAPMKNNRRPNTLDTVELWLKQTPKTGSTLAISNQPYVHYQGAVLDRVVPFEVETVGGEIMGSPTIALMLDTFAREYIYKHGDLQCLLQHQ